MGSGHHRRTGQDHRDPAALLNTTTAPTTRTSEKPADRRLTHAHNRVENINPADQEDRSPHQDQRWILGLAQRRPSFGIVMSAKGAPEEGDPKNDRARAVGRTGAAVAAGLAGAAAAPGVIGTAGSAGVAVAGAVGDASHSSPRSVIASS